MSKILEYESWDDLDKLNQDLIDAIDGETKFDEDLGRGKIKIKVEYVGPDWDENLNFSTEGFYNV